MLGSMRRTFLGVIAIVLALVATACTTNAKSTFHEPYVKTIWGPDVSNYQHPYGAGAADVGRVVRVGVPAALVHLHEGETRALSADGRPVDGRAMRMLVVRHIRTPDGLRVRPGHGAGAVGVGGAGGGHEGQHDGNDAHEGSADDSPHR